MNRRTTTKTMTIESKKTTQNTGHFSHRVLVTRSEPVTKASLTAFLMESLRIDRMCFIGVTIEAFNENMIVATILEDKMN